MMRTRHYRLSWIGAALLLAGLMVPMSLFAADPPAPPGTRETLRARVAHGLAAGDLAEAQRALMDWLGREPDSVEALVAQAGLYEKQGNDVLAYAVLSHAVALPSAPPTPAAETGQNDDPAGFASRGQVRTEPAAGLWTAYRRLQNKLYHLDELPDQPVAAPATSPVAAAAANAAPASAPASPEIPPAPPSPPAAAMLIPISCPEDAEFSRDPHGQWAVSAEASSVYGPVRWSASQATGPPDVASYGDNDHAWASKLADAGEEWIKLTFATPVRASAVRARQTLYPGAISRVEVFSADGHSAVVWTGQAAAAAPANTILWFVAKFEPPPFAVQSVKLTLDSAAVYGWNEIDAVQLVGAP
jgi:hypothetical protein